MLKKKYRLSARVRLERPLVFQALFFTLRVSKNNFPYSRYGFVVSKKVDKRAVVRNSVKRKIRAYIEAVQEKVSGGNDMLFHIKKRATQVENTSLYREIEQVLRKEKLLT